MFLSGQLEHCSSLLQLDCLHAVESKTTGTKQPIKKSFIKLCFKRVSTGIILSKGLIH